MTQCVSALRSQIPFTRDRWRPWPNAGFGLGRSILTDSEEERLSSKWIARRLDWRGARNMNGPESQVTRVVAIALVVLIIVLFAVYQLQHP
jgi:hypothetical protein